MTAEYSFSSKLVRGLTDRLYEKRKASAMEIERLIREQLNQNDHQGVKKVLSCLVKDFAYSAQPYTRGGGLIALAASAIALGTNEIGTYLDDIVPPVLACFSDHDTQVKYYACEAMYNIAKVARGEILRFFNEVFDALSKTAADSDKAVKRGSELLNRIIVDIVSEEAVTYVSTVTDQRVPSTPTPYPYLTINVNPVGSPSRPSHAELAFSLERFIPLLIERVHTLNPSTRVFLVNWLRLLDSLPELELIHYLPQFLREIFLYLSDPNEEVRTVTNMLLTDFLVELGRISRAKAPSGSPAANGTLLSEPLSGVASARRASSGEPSTTHSPTSGHGAPPVGSQNNPPARSLNHETLVDSLAGAISDPLMSQDKSEPNNVAWVRRQEVDVDFPALVKIITRLLDAHESDVQLTALQWVAKFMGMVPDVVISFTPQLIGKILPSLSHSNSAIKKAAVHASSSLYQLIEEMPSLDVTPGTPKLEVTSVPSRVTEQQEPSSGLPSPKRPVSPTSAQSGQSTDPTAGTLSTGVPSGPTTATGTPEKLAPGGSPAPPKDRTTEVEGSPSDVSHKPGAGAALISGVIEPGKDRLAVPASQLSPTPAKEIFSFESTVTTLIVTYSNGQEDTRIACVDWLLMLHRRAPLRMAKEETLVSNDGSFPVFLKIMSDPSEEVVKKNLQLLAQFSAYLDTDYFQRFMVKLLELFSTDRQLLECRGSLIIRRLCVSLNAELIYRTIAEILETNEDHEFASMMVQNLNIILITAPELVDLRRRLRYLDNRENQQLFIALYRSWCHSPVATFTLCLLAQAYEHAANLLPGFAEMEMTVALLIQIDKLVQLIESPVFTYMRLQLLEPERHPYLYKSLYGLLMLLPQSNAFGLLRNRLNSVSALGYLHIPRVSGTEPTPSTTISSVAGKRTKGGSGGGAPSTTTDSSPTIRFSELLAHFRQMQLKHAPYISANDHPLSRDISASSTSTSLGAPVEPYGLRRRNSGASQRPLYLSSLHSNTNSAFHPIGTGSEEGVPHRKSNSSPGLHGNRGRPPIAQSTSSQTGQSGGPGASNPTGRINRSPLGPAVKAIRRTIGKR
ncbi:hypothetical protein IWQ61_004588 [Dispira simplex]|nr:hypothetical protein IWQ61_004588 [Dispira simplex]